MSAVMVVASAGAATAGGGRSGSNGGRVLVDHRAVVADADRTDTERISGSVDAARAVFVGDSSIDVATARNAGIPVWALTHGYNMGEPIAASRPDRVLDSLEYILEGMAA